MSAAYEGTPVIASGLEYIIERAYREMQPYMWAREAAVNALEAEASRIEFTVEWQAVENIGVYRRMVVDNGWGMNSRELDLFRQFGETSKRVYGAPNENYGVGVKSGCWPWNPYGFVVISRKDGETNMLWVAHTGGEYELKQMPVLEDEDEIVLKHVFPTFEDEEHGCDWEAVFPEWVEEHGTAIVLMGDSPNADTIRGDRAKGEDGLTGVQKFLNERLYSLPQGVEVGSIEFVNADRERWPKSASDRKSAGMRQVRGARAMTAYWDEAPKHGRVALADGTEVEWILASTDHVKPLANEEPKKGETLVYDTTGRSSLLANNSQPLPRDRWAETFALNLPQAIVDALKEQREKEVIEGGVEDEESAKRLQARFGARWKLPVLRMAQKGGEKMLAALPGSTPRAPIRRRERHGGSTVERIRAVTGLKVTDQQTVGFADALGTPKGRRSHAAIDLPKVEVVTAAGFMDDPAKWAATWIAPSQMEPRGIVQINRDHPVVEEQAEYWAQRVPDHAAEEALRKVPFILGEIVACNVAHNNRFKSVPGVAEQGVEEQMRSSASLTNVILGLIQTDAVIGPKLGYLGKTKTVAS